MWPLLIPAITQIVMKAIDAASQNPNNSLHPQDVPAVQQEVTKTVVKELQESPQLQHLTNNEPWYQSRVTLGSLGSILGGAATMMTMVATNQYDPQLYVTPLMAIGGGVFALYGRWKAR